MFLFELNKNGLLIGLKAMDGGIMAWPFARERQGTRYDKSVQDVLAAQCCHTAFLRPKIWKVCLLLLISFPAKAGEAGKSCTKKNERGGFRDF